jgi:hypothetical protein
MWDEGRSREEWGGVPTPPLPPPGGARPWWRALRTPLLAYLVSRAVVLAAAGVAAAVLGDPGRGPWPALPGGGDGAVRALGRFDGGWYLDVALRGYPGVDQLDGRLKSLAFFPLYPLTIRGLHDLTGLPPLAVGVLVSTVLGGLAVALVWLLVREVEDEAAATRAAAAFAFFPGAFVLSMAYSEALLVAAAGACLLLLVRRWWVTAGIAAAVATAARPNAAVLIGACAWAAAVAIHRRRDWSSLWAVALAPTGLLAYFGFLWVRTGDPLGWFRSQSEAWRDHVDFGGTTIGRVVNLVHEPHLSLGVRELNDVVNSIGLLFVAGGVVLLLRWRPPGAVVVYGLGVLATALASDHVGARPRFLLAAFPLVLAVGVRLDGKRYYAALGTSAAALAVFSFLVFGTRAVTP